LVVKTNPPLKIGLPSFTTKLTKDTKRSRQAHGPFRIARGGEVIERAFGAFSAPRLCVSAV
jgi:hypothetical protein